MAYIYRFKNKNNGKSYIGQTTNIKRRFRDHAKARSKNGVFSSSIRKNGIESFDFCILEECEECILSEREEYWIDRIGSMHPNGYNMIKGDIHGSRSDETRNRHRESAKKRYKNPKFKKENLDHIKAMGKNPEIQKTKSDSMRKFLSTEKGKRQLKQSLEKMMQKNNGKGIARLNELCKDPSFIKKRAEAKRSKVIYEIKKKDGEERVRGTIYEITSVQKKMSRVDFSSIKSGKQKSAKGWVFIGEAE